MDNTVILCYPQRNSMKMSFLNVELPEQSQSGVFGGSTDTQDKESDCLTQRPKNDRGALLWA